MISFIGFLEAQKQLASHVRKRRLQLGLTQAGLSARSGVKLPTLRKFEQQGQIALASFLKLLSVVGGLDEVIQALKPSELPFSSIDEVLEANQDTARKRGWIG